MPGDVTLLLSQLAGGDTSAVDRILPLVYQDLHSLAGAFLRQERPDHTLQPTALVNEAYLRLVDQRSGEWKDKAHFVAIASQAMRRVLVDHARMHNRAKRGGKCIRTVIDADMVFVEDRAEDILALDEALTHLAAINPQAARTVEMRCFGGLTIDESARVLGVSTSTVERQWRYARAWLHRELSGDSPRKESDHRDGP